MRWGGEDRGRDRDRETDRQTDRDRDREKGWGGGRVKETIVREGERTSA